MKKKAMVAMSGGVDSSVAAYLMIERGFETIGVTMKLFDAELIGREVESSCCSLSDVEDARSVANRLGIKHYVFNFQDDFRTCVVDRFVDAYEKGLTPNPCIDCNRFIKFKRLMHRARELEQDYVVTGHYVRNGVDANGRHLLMRGLDRSKDQSYVLYSLTQDELKQSIFPLGELTKDETRDIAEAQGFLNAKKKDSQDICFVPDGNYESFIREYTGKDYPEGEFVSVGGDILGTHKGLVNYTIGQRKGLGLALPEPLYVKEKDVEGNRIILARNDELYSKTAAVEDVNWIAIEGLTSDLNCTVKVRYSQSDHEAKLIPISENEVRVEFKKPERAITPGQAAVFYDGDVVIGGGTIRAARE
ncbi:MAG: tRNA 2-thiouridine(34) synthase MnmA [Firmicutes bacterium]|nr:tRNA 2-thiouridine(34) synthase MnmA [Bacillota bacterium]